MPSEHPWRSRLGGLRSVLDDPANFEVLVAPSGKIVARDSARRPRAIHAPPLSPSDAHALARALARALGVALTNEHPSAHGSLDASLEVSIAIAPIVRGGPAIAFSRRAEKWTTLAELRDDGTLEPRVALVLERASAIASSVLVVGRKRRDRQRVLGAIASARSVDRRLAALGAGLVPDAEITAHDLIVLAPSALDSLPDLAFDALLVEDPTPAQWSALLTGGVPFLASSPALDLEGAIERLVGAVAHARPGIARAGADALIASAIDLVVELGDNHDRTVIVSLSELERTPEGLAPNRLAHLRPEGGVDLAIRGSKLERRFEHRGHETSLPGTRPRPSNLRSGSALLGRGGISVIGSNDDSEGRPASGPVGRLTREQLMELTPEQLVSQSFIVDVSELTPQQGAVRLVDDRRPSTREKPGNGKVEERPPPARSSTDLDRHVPGVAGLAEDLSDSTVDLEDISRTDGPSTSGAISAAIEKLGQARSRLETQRREEISQRIPRAPRIPAAVTPIAPLPIPLPDGTVDDDLPLFRSGDGDRTLNAERSEMLASAGPPSGNGLPAMNGDLVYRAGSMTLSGGLLAIDEIEHSAGETLVPPDIDDSALEPDATLPKHDEVDQNDGITGANAIADAARASAAPPSGGSTRRKLR